jgi:hypothetical protein
MIAILRSEDMSASTRLPLAHFARRVMLPGLALAALFACQPKPAPETTTTPTTPGTVASADTAAQIRDSIQHAQPGSYVGRVIAVSTTYGPYAAVGDIPTQDVKVGQVLTFVDQTAAPVNNGTVMQVAGDTLHVRYDPNGRRPVQVGDLAVWLNSNPTTQPTAKP